LVVVSAIVMEIDESKEQVWVKKMRRLARVT
jgi:hypothetical protein